MKRKTKFSAGFVIFLTLLVGTHLVDAQMMHPEAGFLFDDAEVPRIDLTISESNLQSLYADPESNSEYYAVFTISRGDSTVGPLDVGLRFRGDTIRQKKKKSFRISFNAFDSDDHLYGIEKMNLNAEVNDPSLIRSKLTWEMFRYLGVPSSRSNHVLLYINNSFYGVYLNTEHIDERFVKSRFDNNDGNLYRNLWPADLAYLGSAQSVYKYEYEGRRAYALRTNEDWDDYMDLAQLITILDQYSGDQLKAELEEKINVQQYLKALAVDVMSGNWDGYSGDKNNYYLYRDQVTNRFEYIPYNPENSFGIDFRGEDWSTRSIYSWNLDFRPLYEKIMGVEEYKAQYSMYIKQLAAYFASASLAEKLTDWSMQISDFVALDPYYSLDWGFTFSDFQEAKTNAWGGHVNYGVMDFITARSSSALEECIDENALPLFTYVKVEPRSDRIDLAWTTEDDEPGFTTTLHYRIDEGSWNTILKDTPAEIDPVSGHYTFRDTIRPMADTAEVELYFTLVDQGGQENRYPDTSMVISFPLISGPLYINEFAASNQGITKDEFGEYEDWVEVYNASNEAVWLASYFLSDNMGSPGKYRFPEIFLKPGGFYLVWLDDDEEQGLNHAPFKISKDGEELRLSEMPSTGFHLVDSVKFGAQESDISMGRLVDGEAEWSLFPSPTPGYSNLSTHVNEILPVLKPLSIYPNPVSGGLVHFNKRVSGAVYNLMGQRMMEVVDVKYVSVPLLAEGFYIFRSSNGESVQFIVSR
jgi:CotH kinase protein/Lamin Tail Domain